MAATTLKQKISLAFLGVFLSGVLLELGLRLGGITYLYIQESRNQPQWTEDEYRILCIGESTTAMGGENAYPSQLEQILSERSSAFRFKVINRGVVGKSTSDILSDFPMNLQKYKPHLVIAMLGVNDRSALGQERQMRIKIYNFFKKLRVVQLVSAISEHVMANIRERRGRIKAPMLAVSSLSDLEENLRVYDEWAYLETEGQRFDDPREVANLLAPFEHKILEAQRLLFLTERPEQTEEIARYIKMLRYQQSWLLLAIGVYHEHKQHFVEADQFLKMAITAFPSNEVAYILLGRVYKRQGKCDIAIPVLLRAIELNSQNVLAYIELGRCYQAEGRVAEAYETALKILDLRPQKVVWAYPEIGQWLADFDYLQEAEKFFLEGIRMNPYDPEIFYRLAELYMRMGREDEAQQYIAQGQGRQRTIDQYLPITVRNYNLIATLSIKEGIPLIAMQYPLRSALPLRNLFWSISSVTIVENKTNFEQAIMRDDYDTYFSDYFAGDFGHCTRAGNRLIAENLAEVILTGIVKEQ